MRAARAANRGTTRLRLKRRATDPMHVYDSLPPTLRGWLAQAVLPWSPASCRAIWLKARAEGASEADVLDRLDRAERASLQRDARGRKSARSSPDGRTAP